MAAIFSVARDDVINRALRLTGAFDATNPPSTVDYANCSLAFNILIKQWIKSGIPMWKVVTLLVPTTVGQPTIQIGPFALGTGAFVCDKIMRVLYAFIRQNSATSAQFDIPIDPLSMQEYNQYGDKLAQGVPNSYWFLPGEDDSNGPASTLTLYPTSVSTTYSVGLVCYQQLADVNVGTDPVDFPSECYNALCWGLADEISMEYATNLQRVEEIRSRAKEHYDSMVDWSQENTDIIRLMYDRRGQYGGF